MRETPAKRWVHKGEYRGLVVKRILWCAAGIIGVVIYVAFNCLINYSPSTPTPTVVDNAPFHPGIFGWALIIIGVIIAIVLLLLELSQIFGFVYECFKAGSGVESVRLITPRNHHPAPSEECLVRPSDLPPSQQQAELLRPGQSGQETPPEELLRATCGQDREG